MSAVAKVVATELEDWRILDDDVALTVVDLDQESDFEISTSGLDVDSEPVTQTDESEAYFRDVVEVLTQRTGDLSLAHWFFASEMYEGELDIDPELATPTIAIESYFRSRVMKWKQDTSHLSLVSLRITHPAYREIVLMGRQALPLILAELEEEPDHWFHALMTLADENPVPAGFSGSVSEAAALWVEWGRSRKLIPDAA